MHPAGRYSDSGHLPKLRPGGAAAHPRTLPRQRRGVTPQMVGRYPDYDVLQYADAWDEATRAVVLARLEPNGSLRFFSDSEEPTARAFCDTVTAQDGEPRIPVIEMIDEKLSERRFDGYRYAGMPDDDETWRRVLAGLDEVSCHRYGRRFHEIPPEARDALCGEMSRGVLDGGVCDTIDCRRAWTVCMRTVLAAFYAHPWAWNEIGFGGPAYPLGYMRLGPGMHDPHERPEAVHDDPVFESEAELVP